MTAVLLACAASTLFMAGVAWFVQVVHYPLFSLVGDDRFEEFHDLHSRRTTIVVGPPMLAELVTSLVLLADPPGDSLWLAAVGAGLAVATWAITGLLLAPWHGRIGREGPTTGNLSRLVQLSWPRTFLWTGHAAVVLAMLGLVVGWT